MKGYVICILVTIFFAFLSQELLKKNRKIVGIFFLIISLLIPCIVAGVRDFTVGVDITTYVKGLFYRIQENGFTILNEYKKYGLELGFIIVVYLSTLIFNNLSFTLFMIELAIALPVFVYAYLQRNNKSIVFTILVFLLTMYCLSLSMMRQSIAISLILLSTYFLENRNYKKTLLLYIMAILFHQSAAVAILIYLCYYIIKKYKNNRVFYLFFLLIFIGFFCLLIPSLLPYLPFKYDSYLLTNYATSVNLLSILKILVWIVPTGICMSLCKKEKNDYYDLLIFSISLIFLTLIFYLVGIKVSIASRLSLYFLNIYYFILLPLFQVKIKPKEITNICLIALITFLWWHMTAVDFDISGVYPYHSSIVEFLNQ